LMTHLMLHLQCCWL